MNSRFTSRLGHMFSDISFPLILCIYFYLFIYFDQIRWIGLTDSFVEGSYRWESDKSLVDYTHWAKKEPNDYGGVEDCVAVYWGKLAGFWNDDYCDSEHYYICEKVNGMKVKLHRFY